MTVVVPFVSPEQKLPQSTVTILPTDIVPFYGIMATVDSVDGRVILVRSAEILETVAEFAAKEQRRGHRLTVKYCKTTKLLLVTGADNDNRPPEHG